MSSDCLWEVAVSGLCDEEGSSLPHSAFIASFCSLVASGCRQEGRNPYIVLSSVLVLEKQFLINDNRREGRQTYRAMKM